MGRAMSAVVDLAAVEAELDEFKDGLSQEVSIALLALVRTQREKLEAIARGEGRFSLNTLEHAANTIEDMKALALAALALATDEGRRG